MPKTTPIDTRTPGQRTMNDKILNIVQGNQEGKGLTLTPREVVAFKAMMRAMYQRQVDTDGQLTMAQGVNLAMAEALNRQGFQLTHAEHEDGSVSYDLQNAPQPVAETIN